MAVGRPDGGQVPEYFAVRLLCVESGEAGMEAIEREICGSKADSDPLYDMHYNNATGLIRRLNPPPVKEYQTPLFYRTGGMK